MDLEELRTTLNKYIAGRENLHVQLVQASRGVVHILKDLGHKSSAQQIEEILFQYDALLQEFSDAVLKAGSETFTALLRDSR
jgi:hypothetical protein